MKKYGKLGLTVLSSIIIIGSFYTYQAFAGSSTPDYTIETRSGDESYIEDMVLFGNISNEEKMYWDFLQISHEGTKSTEDFTLGERLDSLYAYNPGIQYLYHQHKDFLLDKSMSANLYSEDDESIAYANVYMDNYELPYEQLEIAVLDKESGDEDSILVDIPEYDRYDSLYIEEVQKSGNEVILFTMNLLINTYEGEMHVYRVNVENGEVKDQIIHSETSEMGQDAYSSILINSLDSSHDMEPESYMIYERSPNDLEDTDAANKAIFAYSIASGELKELAIPNELKAIAPHQGIKVQGSSIYYTNIKEDGFEITRFDIEANEVADTQTIGLPSEVMQYFLPTAEENYCLTYIEDNTIYYISAIENAMGKNVAIVAGDLETGQVMYDGKLTKDSNMSESFKDNSLYIESVIFH